MEFRRTVEEDVNRVMEIIKQAQDYFKECNIDQWQNGYPNLQIIKEDIKNGWSYVLLKDNDIVATAAISFDKETTYERIHDGKWLSNDAYAVIHRIAVDRNLKGLGLGAEIMKEAEKLMLSRGVHSIKIDTHEHNISMQKLLKKNGFQYCGVIYLEDHSKRVAFEKII